MDQAWCWRLRSAPCAPRRLHAAPSSPPSATGAGFLPSLTFTEFRASEGTELTPLPSSLLSLGLCWFLPAWGKLTLRPRQASRYLCFRGSWGLSSTQSHRSISGGCSFPAAGPQELVFRGTRGPTLAPPTGLSVPSNLRPSWTLCGDVLHPPSFLWKSLSRASHCLLFLFPFLSPLTVSPQKGAV